MCTLLQWLQCAILHIKNLFILYCTVCVRITWCTLREVSSRFYLHFSCTFCTWYTLSWSYSKTAYLTIRVKIHQIFLPPPPPLQYKICSILRRRKKRSRLPMLSSAHERRDPPHVCRNQLAGFSRKRDDWISALSCTSRHVCQCLKNKCCFKSTDFVLNFAREGFWTIVIFLRRTDETVALKKCRVEEKCDVKEKHNSNSWRSVTVEKCNQWKVWIFKKCSN